MVLLLVLLLELLLERHRALLERRLELLPVRHLELLPVRHLQLRLRPLPRCFQLQGQAERWQRIVAGQLLRQVTIDYEGIWSWFYGFKNSSLFFLRQETTRIVCFIKIF
jgi:hypothetical protein